MIKLNKRLLHNITLFSSPTSILRFQTLKYKPFRSTPINYRALIFSNKSNFSLLKSKEIPQQELFPDIFQQNLAEDDPVLNNLLFSYGLELLNSGSNFQERAIRIFQILESNFQKNPNMKKQMKDIYFPCVLTLGNLLTIDHKFQESLDVLKRFKNSFQEFDEQNLYINDLIKAKFYSSCAINYQYLQNFKSALEFYKKAVFFAEKLLKNQDQHQKIGAFLILLNYAQLQLLSGDLQKGLKTFERLSQMLINYSHIPQIIPIWSHFCQTSCNFRYFDVSFKKCQQLIEIIEKNNLTEIYPHEYYKAYTISATILENQNNFEGQLIMWERILKFVQNTKTLPNKDCLVIVILIEQAKVYLLLESEDESYNHICKALDKVKMIVEFPGIPMSQVFQVSLSTYGEALETQSELIEKKIKQVFQSLKKQLLAKMTKNNP